MKEATTNFDTQNQTQNTTTLRGLIGLFYLNCSFFSPYALALIIPLITIGFIKYTFTNQFNQLSLVAPKQGILGAVPS